MKCIAVLSGKGAVPDLRLFQEITGVQCIKNCTTHYWLYVTHDFPAGSIEGVRDKARAICRDFHHPNHPQQFGFEVE